MIFFGYVSYYAKLFLILCEYINIPNEIGSLDGIPMHGILSIRIRLKFWLKLTKFTKPQNLIIIKEPYLKKSLFFN